MDYQKSRVEKIANNGPVGASELLRRARGGDLDALADFITWSLYKKNRDDGLTHQEAIDGAWVLIQVTDINLKAIG